jgi:hypothetical protein
LRTFSILRRFLRSFPLTKPSPALLIVTIRAIINSVTASRGCCFRASPPGPRKFAESP